VLDGFKIRFWHDILCEEKILKVAFLELFSVARFKDAYVVDHLLVTLITALSVLSEHRRIERLISLPRSSIFVLHQTKTGWRKTSGVGPLSRDGCLTITF